MITASNYTPVAERKFLGGRKGPEILTQSLLSFYYNMQYYIIILGKD